MSRFRCVLFCLLLLLFLSAYVPAEETCPALSVSQTIPGRNIFSPQQEVWLGDAQGAELEQSLTILRDKVLTNYLQDTVDQLARSLPPDHIPFRVRLVDLSNAGAFSIAGGRIYVSRKIVAFTRSQDELAGLLAHEMGHIIAHHAAIQASQQFRLALGITQVTDREDVFAKWNQLVSNYRRQKADSYDKAFALEEREQLQADSIALYLMTRAGYSPQAFQSFFDRLAETKGDAGGFWSNLFGTSKPDSKRLAQIIRNTPAMPSACMTVNTTAAADYERWKKSVIEVSAVDLAHEEALTGLVSKRILTERLRPEIQYVRISRDGRYVLAQEDSNVFILERQPLKPLFRLGAPDAEAAQFTPDSRGVVFLFAGLGSAPRVERWDIASQQRAEVHEIYVRDGCLLSRVAPDGKSLACLTLDTDTTGFLKFDLDLYDVAAATSYFHKKGWVTFDLARMFWFADLQLLKQLEGLTEKWLTELSPMAFSPDGHYFVAHSRQNVLAMDLLSRNQVDLPGSIKGLLDYSFAFLPDGALVGVAGSNGEKSQVVEFPGGKVLLKDLNIGGSHVEAAAHGDHVLLRPIKDHPVGIFDLKQNKIVVASKRGALDLWDDRYIAERLDGDLQVFDIGGFKPVEHAQLPDAPLGKVRANALSPDLNWLAISQKTRGAVWNLQTGERLYHLRGFSAAYFAPDGGLYADFPKYLSTDRMLARATLSTPDIRPQKTIDEKKHTTEVGRYLLTVVPTKEYNTREDVSFELSDVIDEKVIWNKHFAHERPGYHVDSRANSLVFYWKADSQSAKSIAKEDSEAAAVLGRLKDKDSALFLQAFDLDTGKLRGEFALDTGKHSFQVVEAIATGDRVIIADNRQRVQVYSFDGQLKGTIAGHAPEVSATSDLLTVKTESTELELYDLRDVSKRTTYDFDSPVAFDGFSADGKRLLVLTSTQTVYVLDPAAKQAASAVASN